MKYNKEKHFHYTRNFFCFLFSSLFFASLKISQEYKIKKKLSWNWKIPYHSEKERKVSTRLDTVDQRNSISSSRLWWQFVYGQERSNWISVKLKVNENSLPSYCCCRFYFTLNDRCETFSAASISIAILLARLVDQLSQKETFGHSSSLEREEYQISLSDVM